MTVDWYFRTLIYVTLMPNEAQWQRGEEKSKNNEVIVPISEFYLITTLS